MRAKLGLEFTIVNIDLMAQVRRTDGMHANPFLMFLRVMVSMAWHALLTARRAGRGAAEAPDAGEHRTMIWMEHRIPLILISVSGSS